MNENKQKLKDIDVDKRIKIQSSNVFIQLMTFCESLSDHENLVVLEINLFSLF